MTRGQFFFRHLRFACSPDRDLFFPQGRWQFIREIRRWMRQAYGIGYFPWKHPERATLMILSYKRPWNIEATIRIGLKMGCIEKIIVSNNNPTIDIHQYVRVRDQRLTVMTQDRRRSASIMPLLAADATHEGRKWFLAVDDDLLLFPEQIEMLLTQLRNQPAVVHGVVGQVLTGERPPHFEMHVTGEREVDVLNRAYAFTAAHALQYQHLLSALGRTTREQQMDMPFGSDIVLSATGGDRPRIHDVGPLLSCPTAAMPGIARFKDEGFDAFRAALFQSVTAITHSAPSARRAGPASAL